MHTTTTHLILAGVFGASVAALGIYFFQKQRLPLAPEKGHFTTSWKSTKPGKQQAQKKKTNSEKIDQTLTEDEIKSTEYQSFLQVKKNQVAVITNLVHQARTIEFKFAEEKERLRLLRIIRQCLFELSDHSSQSVRELSWLAPKMKDLSLSAHHFLGLFLPIERKYTRGLRDDEFIVTDKDRIPPQVPTKKIPLYLILHNLRSAFNVGAIFRTADCIGVSHIYLSGYTVTPDSHDVLEKTTMGAHEAMAWSYHKTLDEVFSQVKERNVPIFALETVEDPSLIFTPELYPRTGCALLLGNERFGIEADVLKKCDQVVSIPCRGVKNSLNVGVALGICGYEILRQWEYTNYAK